LAKGKGKRILMSIAKGQLGKSKENCKKLRKYNILRKIFNPFNSTET